MLTRLLNVEPNVFRRIALFTVFDSDFPAPLRDFLSLSLVCHASHRTLSENYAPLYFAIFAEIFDILGPLNRLGANVVKEHAKEEIKRRFTALKVLRRGDLDDSSLTEAFWVAYVMFEDSERGHKNAKHLLATGLHSLLHRFLQQRLYLGSETNHGWPIPSEQNSLAVALLWLSSSLRPPSPFLVIIRLLIFVKETITRETKEQYEEVARLLQPLVFAAFRYPIFSTAESCFDIATYTHQPTSASIHGPYPPPPLMPRDVVYFGPVSRSMRIPLISLFASLSFFARKEIVPYEIPRHLYPENRTAGTHKGPTIDDIRHFYEHCQTHFADSPHIDVGVIRRPVGIPSTLSASLTLIEPPSYRLGTLTGKWQGSFIIPFLDSYEDWLNMLTAPPEFDTPGRFPLYMSLQEHYVCDSSATIPSGRNAEGTMNAWLPTGFKWNLRKSGIQVFDDKGSFRSFYHTFRRGDKPPSGRVVDVIITGETDARHAAAWGDHEIIGRARLEDGLIMLARKPLTEDIGTTLLRGYVTTSQNFVGRFKGVSSGTQPASWEAVFSLCQVRQRSVI